MASACSESSTTITVPRQRSSMSRRHREFLFLAGLRGGTRSPCTIEYQTVNARRLSLTPGDYLIIGEKPTPPYDLITVRLPLTFFSIGGISGRGFSDGTEGSVVFWAIERTEKSIILHTRKTGAEISFVRNRQPNPTLLYVHSVWDLRLNCLSQVLVWMKRPDLLRIEFRHGEYCGEAYISCETAQICSVCFRGLNGPENDSAIVLAKEMRILVFQRNMMKTEGVDSEYWTSKSINSINNTGGASSVLSTVELDAFTSDYCERLSPPNANDWNRYERRRNWVKAHTSILSADQKWSSTIIQVLHGAFDFNTQSYFLFTLELTIPSREIKVKKCTRLGGQMTTAARWKQLLDETPEKLFAKAFMASQSNKCSVTVAEGVVNHSCEKSCFRPRSRFPTPQKLPTFTGVSVQAIHLPRNRIRLVMRDEDVEDENEQ